MQSILWVSLMLNQIQRCSGCGKPYHPLYDMFDVRLDIQFVERFGMDEYFQLSRKVFINPLPINIRWAMDTDSQSVRFVDGIRSCPYCDVIELEEPEMYYVKFFKELKL